MDAAEREARRLTQVEDVELARQMDVLVAALRTRRYRYANEDDLQLGITQVLTLERVPFVREVRLAPREKIDFMVGRIGVEVKIKGSFSSVARQLLRYAPHVDALVLVTGRSQLDRMPPTLGGKPVRVVALLGGIL
jgi:hypothetical protein